jgi:hypothetical protein
MIARQDGCARRTSKLCARKRTSPALCTPDLLQIETTFPLF